MLSDNLSLSVGKTLSERTLTRLVAPWDYFAPVSWLPDESVLAQQFLDSKILG